MVLVKLATGSCADDPVPTTPRAADYGPGPPNHADTTRAQS